MTDSGSESVINFIPVADRALEQSFYHAGLR